VQMSPPLRVLVVEDQALLALELEMTLVDLGCEVVGCAMDSASALEVAAQASPDLAFVDINLRDGCTGPKVAGALTADHGCAVVFITANPEQAPRDSDALGLICKPCDAETIAGVVRFVDIFRRERRIGSAPARFRMAPGLVGASEARNS